MRFTLAALIALHAPVSAVAAVVVRMPAIEASVPAAGAFASPSALSAPASSSIQSALAPSLAASMSAAPADVPVAAPVPAAQPAAAPLAALPALSAALPAPFASPAPASNRPSAGLGLKALAASLEKNSGAPALDSAFELSRAAADGPQGPRESAEPRSAPTLSSAPKTPTSPWRTAVPNLLTFSNMASGLAAMSLASEGKFALAGAMILLGNLFDALDGRSARMLGVDNELGIDLDSLADVVTFGAAPAFLVFKAALQPAWGWWGFPIAAAFAAAGVYRLARFNVGAHAEKSGAAPAKKSDSFTGLPIPGGAGIIVALTLALASIPAAFVAPAAAAITLLTATAMASRLPYPAFKKGGMKALAVPAALGLSVAAPLVALGLSAFVPAAIFGLYLSSGPLIALSRRSR